MGFIAFAGATHEFTVYGYNAFDLTANLFDPIAENQFKEIGLDNTEETIKSIIRAIEEKDHLALHKAKTSNKNLKENAHVVENLIKDYYNMACNLKTKEKLDQNLVDFIKKNNDYKTLIRKTKYINGLLNKLSKNMNIDLMLEKMFFDMKEVKKK